MNACMRRTQSEFLKLCRRAIACPSTNMRAVGLAWWRHPPQMTWLRMKSLHGWWLAAAVVSAALAGCASTAAAVRDVADYKQRAVTRVDGRVRVSTAALSSEESAAVYGVPLAKKSIQPVWIEVENHDDRAYYLMSPGLDPNFFPASETAETFASGDSREQVAALDRRFGELAFHNPVRPGTTVSGFVLTHLDEGGKLVQIDLVASQRTKSFSILTIIPGFRADYHVSGIFRHEMPGQGEVVDFGDDAAFLQAVARLPCCVTNKQGDRNGDPLNLVVVGGFDDVLPAFVRRGWRPTEQKWTGSIAKMVTSALSGEPYAYAPISDLYFFGRAQDFALQKARDNIHQRNHLRLWLSAMRYQGKPVWVGQISRDIGSRLTIHSPTLTTHKIDPDVDEARGALGEDMAYSEGLVKIGYARGVVAAPRAAPRENLTTDPYYTDGLRLVMVFDNAPTSLEQIEFFADDILGVTHAKGAR